MKKNVTFTIATAILTLLLCVTLAFAGALTANRNTPARDGKLVSLSVAIANRIWQGSMVAVDASGYAVPATASTAVTVVGRAEEYKDNRLGAAGALTIQVGRGVYRFANQAGVGNVASADDVGKYAYVLDDQTVSLSHSSGTRPTAGFIVDVDSSGVWVDFSRNTALGYLSAGQLGTSAISIEDLDSGLTMGFKAFLCNISAAETDSDSIVTETRTGIAATDVVVAIINSSTNATWVRRGYATTNTMHALLNSTGGAGTTINWCAYRAAN